MAGIRPTPLHSRMVGKLEVIAQTPKFAKVGGSRRSGTGRSKDPQQLPPRDSGVPRPYNRAMQRSAHKILTTHVGSLPAPEGLNGEAAVRQLVERQRQTGLDIINEGEYTKGGDWLSFTDDRFGGFTAGERKGPPIVTLGKDREEFAGFYKWASERGTLFFEPG